MGFGCILFPIVKGTKGCVVDRADRWREGGENDGKVRSLPGGVFFSHSRYPVCKTDCQFFLYFFAS